MPPAEYEYGFFFLFDTNTPTEQSSHTKTGSQQSRGRQKKIDFFFGDIVQHDLYTWLVFLEGL